MLFYARQAIYASTRSIITHSTRFFSRSTTAPSSAARSPQRSSANTTRVKKAHFGTTMTPVSRRRKEGQTMTFRKAVIYYIAPPRMVHFPQERDRHARYVWHLPPIYSNLIMIIIKLFVPYVHAQTLSNIPSLQTSNKPLKLYLACQPSLSSLCSTTQHCTILTHMIVFIF